MAKARSIDESYVADWIERVANFFVLQNGLPAITGRALGWLLICDPAEQSAGDIAAAIGASRASLTTTMRVLITIGFVRRITRPGSRTTFYRIDDDAWEKVIRLRIAALTSFSHLTDEAIERLGKDNPRATRLIAAHTMFDWLAELLAGAPGPGKGKSTAGRRR
ncbi:MAG TPA: transcriptional regulator [Alphaproteobacteria bacterium]|nr:transcriptional regulator [Alphaproteobacteria bacterium]